MIGVYGYVPVDDRPKYEGDNEGLMFDFFPGFEPREEIECPACLDGNHELCQRATMVGCSCWRANHEEEW